MTVKQILAELRARGSETNRAGMGRFGINVDNAFGVSVRELREIAKPIRRDHALALELWNTGMHEARLLATIIADVERFTEAEIARWAGELDSWDLTDGFCGLLTKHPRAWTYVNAWVERKEEFVKRAAFALMARLAVHDKKAPDRTFLDLLPLIVRGSTDERNFVKKAVNWALRQIGKRNRPLNQAAIAVAKRLADSDSRAARWIANDAIRELTSDKVQACFDEL